MLRYAITSRTYYPGDEPARQTSLLAQAARLASAHIDILQLREKDLPAAELVTLARSLLATLRKQSPAPKLLINSRADVALAARADGVHLTSAPGELTPAHIRRLYASANLPAPTISLSCHTLEEIARAASTPNSAPTHILFGPVFEKVVADGEKVAATEKAAADEASAPTHLHEGTGLDLLRLAVAAAHPIPVLALGGVTESNTAACLAAGAAGIAAIRLFL